MARVALMLESDGPGGAETLLLHLAEALRERGHSVVPVGPAHGAGWLGARFREQGFEPRTFLLRRPIDFGCLGGMVRMLRAEGVDVVHSHEFTMAVYGSAACRLLDLPHIITMHGGRNYSRRWRRRAALRWAFRTARRTVAVSAATRTDLAETLGVSESAVSVIPNGIPARGGDRLAGRAALGLQADELLLLAVGNLYPVKGHDVLLRALARLPHEERGRPWSLAVAGRGEEEERLRALAQAGGLERRVRLLGFRDDVPDLLAAADIFVMPSLSEGLPLALVEAMLAGKPIVASRTGGIPEATGEAAALLVPPGDPEPLAAALGRLLEDAELREGLGRRACVVARESFGVEAMASAYERVYGLRSPRRAGSARGVTRPAAGAP